MRFVHLPHLLLSLTEGLLCIFSAQIEEQIRTELAIQVEDAVVKQLPEHIPEDRDAQSKSQLAEARVKLVNSCVSIIVPLSHS